MILILDGSVDGITEVMIDNNGMIIDTNRVGWFFQDKYITTTRPIAPGRKALCGAIHNCKGFPFGIICNVFKNGRWMA